MPESQMTRAAPVLDPDLEIVDSHHHLFDRPAQRYLLEQYWADSSSGHRIASTVYVEMLSFARKSGPDWLRPIGEVEFANGIGARAHCASAEACRVARAIVGYADLTSGNEVSRLLDRYLECAPDRIRGIRQVALSHPNSKVLAHLSNKPPEALLEHPGLPMALKELEARKLCFDATVFHHQLGKLSKIADKHPDLTIVLEHLGLAVVEEIGAESRSAVFPLWKSALADIAQRPNVVCKISGLGSTFWGFDFHLATTKPTYEDLARAWRPYVETAIELFGPSRCMFGSNYPPDSRSAGFNELWNAYKHITAGFTPDERQQLFSGTASHIYRLASAP